MTKHCYRSYRSMTDIKQDLLDSMQEFTEVLERGEEPGAHFKVTRRKMMTDPTKVNADALDDGESIQTTLATLWEILDEGRHQAWAECIKPPLKNGMGWMIGTWSGYMEADPKHALAIVRDSVEGWLVEMGCEIFKVQGTVQYSFNEYDQQFDNLIDAMRYAINQTITHTKE